MGGLLIEGGGDRRGGGGGVPDGDGDSREASRDGASTSGGYNRRLGLAEEPLNSLAIGFVAELPCELKYSGGADNRHAYAPASAINLAMAVLGGRLLDS